MSGAPDGRTLALRSSPHVHGPESTDRIMWTVAAALLPAAGWAVWSFGLTALLTLTASVVVAVGVEEAVARRTGRGGWRDGSAAVTGLLLGLTLPPGLPLWMTAVGAAAALVLGKHVFGGLGANPMNPALVGRALLQAAFPAAMTSWVGALLPGRFTALPASLLAPPLLGPDTADALTSATPLSAWKFDQVVTPTADLLLGAVPGSSGETSALLVALGGLFLLARRVIDWHIPAAVLGTAALLAAALHGFDAAYPTAGFTLGAGGLMLGAFFMATDPVGAPLDPRARLLFGAVIGALTVVIRVWGGMPEGVMYAVLLGNALTPHLDRWLQPRVFGSRRAS